MITRFKYLSLALGYKNKSKLAEALGVPESAVCKNGPGSEIVRAEHERL